MAVGTLIKSVFTEYGYDASYHVAMSWRHINGDRLFGEMWEPHQTSAFVMDLLMIPYRLLVPSASGIVLWLQATGAVLYFIVALMLWKTLKTVTDLRTATLASTIFLAARPKAFTLLEFSNLLILFSTLLMVFLYRFREAEGNRTLQRRYCLICIVITCGLVLAYPTAVLVFLPVLLYFFRTDGKYGRIYLMGCLLAGAAYLSVLLMQNGISVFMENLMNILTSDSSHGHKTLLSVLHFHMQMPYTVNLVFPLLMVAGFSGRKKLTHSEAFLWKMGTGIRHAHFWEF